MELGGRPLGDREIESILGHPVTKELKRVLRISDRRECQKQILAADLKQLIINDSNLPEYVSNEIIKKYLDLRSRGNTRFGRHKTRKAILGWLAMKAGVATDTEIAKRGEEILILKAWGKKRGDRKCGFVDKYAYRLFDYECWQKSLLIDLPPLTENISAKAAYGFLRRALSEKGELRRKIEDGGHVRNWSYLCLAFYSFKQKKLLKSTDEEIAEIWGIPLRTLKRRMTELYCIDC